MQTDLRFSEWYFRRYDEVLGFVKSRFAGFVVHDGTERARAQAEAQFLFHWALKNCPIPVPDGRTPNQKALAAWFGASEATVSKWRGGVLSQDLRQRLLAKVPGARSLDLEPARRLGALCITLQRIEHRDRVNGVANQNAAYGYDEFDLPVLSLRPAPAVFQVVCLDGEFREEWLRLVGAGTSTTLLSQSADFHELVAETAEAAHMISLARLGSDLDVDLRGDHKLACETIFEVIRKWSTLWLFVECLTFDVSVDSDVADFISRSGWPVRPVSL